MQRNDIRLQTDPGSLVLVDDEEIRPRTDLSSVSDLGTGLGVILVLKRLDSARLHRDSFVSSFQLCEILSSIN